MTEPLRILRAFPIRTAATPRDPLVWIGMPDLLTPRDVDRVYVSNAWTYYCDLSERMAEAFADIAPTTLGGPAYGEPGGEFVPLLFLGDGYVITSRGCPNRCWFCAVWKREGGAVRELPIRDGWNVLDDNLLACSESHVRAVFAMLARQGHRAMFTGGLEAARLTDWHADLLAAMRPQPVIFFAYDTPDDWEPLVVAVLKLTGRGMPTAGHRIRAYVLCGHPRDTMDAADRRMRETAALGVFPMAMLWRGQDGRRDPAWRAFARTWANPVIAGVKCRQESPDAR